eukprot:TRINITY_DN7840_c0_g1_i7.p1 TRINITY_DN7840_c0_g1~~TRINITY_DN7840_c0_g1_i7.p1  ORF type:complete len:236 (+),score=42.11 TRINITY_DN7840_c0_g1_i7:593-1300(+)
MLVDPERIENGSFVWPKPDNGGASIVWIQSNCETTSGREHFVRNLQKHMKVDSFGKCLNNKQWPRGDPSQSAKVDGVQMNDPGSTVEIIGRYKFYIAFENANCVDYVTERLVNAFHAGVVPIVDGPPDYSLYAPTNRSVIQADQFKSVAELAEYLKFLDRNDDAYLEYLSHKRHGLGEHFRRVWLRDRREQPWHWGCLCRRAQRDLREQSNSVQASHVLPDLGCRPAGKWTHLRD